MNYKGAQSNEKSNKEIILILRKQEFSGSFLRAWCQSVLSDYVTGQPTYVTLSVGQTTISAHLLQNKSGRGQSRDYHTLFWSALDENLDTKISPRAAVSIRCH